MDKLQRTITRIQPFTIYDNQVYSTRIDFKMPQHVGDLKQIVIKATLSGSITTVQSNFPLLILKNIRLHDGTNTIFESSCYNQIARLDLLTGSPLYDKIISSFTNPTFSSAETFYIPVFCFLDNESLRMEGRRQLYLEITENSSSLKMGLSGTLTDTKYELICFNQRLNVPLSIKNSYSCYNELPHLCHSGSNQTRVLMTCPYPVFYIHFLLLNANTTLKFRALINSVRLDSPHIPSFIDLDDDCNYDLTDMNTGSNSGSTFSIRLGSREVQDTTIKFTQENQGTYVIVDYNEAGDTKINNDYYLYITCEYHTQLDSKDGFVVPQIVGTF